MINAYKRKIINASKYLHFRIFKHEMSRVMENFIASLSWSLSGGVVAAVIIFAVNVLAARWLGPEGYGEYNLVIAIASFLIIPMMLGFEVSASRFISIEKDKQKKEVISRYILKRSIKTIFLTSLLISIIFALLKGEFNIESRIFNFSLILAIGLSLKGISNGIMRGKGQFKKQAMSRLLESIAVGLFFLLLFLFYKQTYESYIFATLIGYVYFVFSSIGKDLTCLKHEEYQNKEILKYSSYAFLGLLSAFFLAGSDKILVGKFINISTLGIYSAYFTVMIAPVTQLRFIFINVLFPEISNSADKSIQFKKIKKLAIFALPFFIIFYSLISFLVMNLFGSQYPIDLWLVIFFSIYAFLFFYVGTSQWILASISTRAMLTSSFIALSAGLLQIILTIVVLIHTQNLRFFLAAMIVSNIIYLVLNNYFVNKSLISQKIN